MTLPTLPTGATTHGVDTAEAGSFLVECIVAVFVFGMIVTTGFTTVMMAIRSSTDSYELNTATDRAQSAADTVESLLREAIDPQKATQLGIPNNCGPLAPGTGAFGKAQAAWLEFCSLAPTATVATYYQVKITCGTSVSCTLTWWRWALRSGVWGWVTMQSVPDVRCAFCHGTTSSPMPFEYLQYQAGTTTPTALNTPTSPAVSAGNTAGIEAVTVTISFGSAMPSSRSKVPTLTTTLRDQVILGNVFSGQV